MMSESEIRSLAVQRCDRATNCADCVALQDPYCAWDVRASRCSSGDWTSNMANGFLQAVVAGKDSQCKISATQKASKEEAISSNSAFLYSYGFDQAPLGQVVNIVDGQNRPTEKQTRREKEAIAGSSDDSVQVIINFSNTLMQWVK